MFLISSWIWTLPQFQRIYYQSSYCDFVLHFDLDSRSFPKFSSAFTSSPITVALQHTWPRVLRPITFPTRYQRSVVYKNSVFWHVYVLALVILYDLGHRTASHTWRHTGAIVHYWYVYRVSREAFRSFSKRYPSYALRYTYCCYAYHFLRVSVVLY
jgi:hypothetical protein